MAFNSEAGTALPFPIIADDKRALAVQLGMLDPDEIDKDGIPLTARCVRKPRLPVYKYYQLESLQKQRPKISMIQN